MRTQGWWMNVSRRHVENGKLTGYRHYCSIWLGDNRTGQEEKAKAKEVKRAFQSEFGVDWKFNLSEEWISGKEHEIGA